MTITTLNHYEILTKANRTFFVDNVSLITIINYSSLMTNLIVIWRYSITTICEPANLIYGNFAQNKIEMNFVGYVKICFVDEGTI